VLENDPTFLSRATELRMKRLSLTDLPLVLQNVLRSELGTTPIDDIDHQLFNGHTVYSVEFQRDGRNHELLAAPDGSLFRRDLRTYALGGISSQPATGTAAAQRIALSELPAAARKTAEREATGALIDSIHQITQNGRTFYEVTYARAGRDATVYLAPDGSLTNHEGVAVASTRRADNQSEEAPLLTAARKVSFEQLPASVQQRVRRELSEERIDHIREGLLRQRRVYDVIYHADGEPREMLIASDGTVLRNRELPGPLPSSQPIVLTQTRRATLLELPDRARDTVRAQIGTGLIDHIDEGLWKGGTAYLVAYQRDGQRRELMVGTDGSILANGSPAFREATLPDR
jgi:uncharacterized membrane protein YkoI